MTLRLGARFSRNAPRQIEPAFGEELLRALADMAPEPALEVPGADAERTGNLGDPDRLVDPRADDLAGFENDPATRTAHLLIGFILPARRSATARS